MAMRRLAFSGPSLVLVVLWVTSCATMLSGTSQQIRISSDPPGATALVDGQTVTTPGSITLKKGLTPVITVRKDGYRDEKVELGILKQRLEPTVWLNLLNLGFGVMVDYAT